MLAAHFQREHVQRAYMLQLRTLLLKNILPSTLLFLLWYLFWGVIGTTLRVGMLRGADKCFDHGRYVFAKADGYGLGPRQHRGLPRPTRPHGASQKMHTWGEIAHQTTEQ